MTVAQAASSYGPLLRRIACRLVSCKEDAEDLVQDTFLRWMNVDASRVDNAKAYLVRTLKNQALNHLQALKRKKEESLESIFSSEWVLKIKSFELSQFDVKERLHAALEAINARLSPLERAVYLLREAFSFDYEELCATLKKSHDHCRQIMSRARKKLCAEPAKPCAHSVAGARESGWKESFERACGSGFLGELIQRLQRDANLA